MKEDKAKIEENKSQGFVKIYRSFVNWEWYDDANTMRLFLHCLLKANHEPTKWHGQIIERGSFITSLSHLAVELGLTVKQIRTCINKLKLTGEMAHKGHNKYSVITVLNYELYQEKGQTIDNQTANKGQSTGNQTATNKNDKNDKKDKNIFIAKSFFQKLIAEDSEVKKFPELHQIFFEWLQYKTDIKKQYKTERTVRGAFFDLVSLSKSDSTSPKLEISARDHVNYAISKGWQGIYSMPKSAKLAVQQERNNNQSESASGTDWERYTNL